MTHPTHWQRLLTIATGDDDIRRRGRNLVQITAALMVTCLLLIGVSLSQGERKPIDVALVLVELICVGVLALARRGRVTLGGALITAVLIPSLLLSLRASSLNSVISLFMTVPLLVAGLVLPPRAIALVLLALGLGAATVGAAVPSAVPPALVGLGIVALLAFLGAGSLRTALAQASAAREHAEQAAAALARANSDLERQVQERTERLQQLLAESEQRAATQARLLEQIAAQRTTIRDLEVPVLPVTQTVLVMPLIGALDDARLEAVRERALSAIEAHRARRLLLDITGVPVVDTAVAQGLIAVVQAARLLGGDVVLIGVRPEVAQTIVGLGLDMSAIHTMRDLQTSIQRLIVSHD